jgi:hypothetical protein
MFRAARPKGAGGLPCKAYQLPDHQVGGAMKTIFLGALCCISLFVAACGGGYDPSNDDRIHANLAAECTALADAYYSAATTHDPPDPVMLARLAALIKANAPESEINALLAPSETRMLADLNSKQRAYKQCEADLLRLDQMQADEAQRRLEAYRAMEAQFRQASFQPPASSFQNQSGPAAPPQAPTDAVSGYEPPPKQQTGCLGVIPVPTIVIATPCPTQ